MKKTRFTEEQMVATVREILAHLGEPTSAPPMAPARGTPLWKVSDAAPTEGDLQAQLAQDKKLDQRIAW